MPRILWALLIYEVPISTVEALEKSISQFLRRIRTRYEQRWRKNDTSKWPARTRWEHANFRRITWRVLWKPEPF